jgi:hypothetical protein
MTWWRSEDESWISYKTLIFLGIVVLGGGYLMHGVANTIKAADDLIDSSDDEN